MAGFGGAVNRAFMRWRADLIEVFGIFGEKRRWAADFSGEITRYDVHYAIFIGVVSMIPAAVVAQASTDPVTAVLNRFFAVPVQTVITAFLMSGLLFLGAHLNRAARPYPVALKLTLRIMSVHPILGFLLFLSWGPLLVLAVYGLLVSLSAAKTYAIPLRNAALFFGSVYFMFALLQLQALVRA